MRTGCSLTVCGGCLLLGGVCSWGLSALLGVSALGGVCSWGDVCSWGVYPNMHWGRHPPPLWTESQMPVKTLPWPNFVAAGKYQWFRKNCLAAKEPEISHVMNASKVPEVLTDRWLTYSFWYTEEQIRHLTGWGCIWEKSYIHLEDRFNSNLLASLI